MTLLLREVGGFLIDSALWVAMAAAIGFVLSSAAASVLATGPDRRLWVAATVGAAVAAAVSDRIGTPTPWSPEVGGRPLPIVEMVIGAAAAIAVVLWARAAAADRQHQR